MSFISEIGCDDANRKQKQKFVVSGINPRADEIALFARLLRFREIYFSDSFGAAVQTFRGKECKAALDVLEFFPVGLSLVELFLSWLDQLKLNEDF